MRNHNAPPALFFVAAIGFFMAGGLMMRTNNVLGASFFPLGGAMVAIGGSLKKRTKSRPA